MHPVHCPAPRAQQQQQAQQCVQGTYYGGWRRCCACLDAKTQVLAVGALASTTCNNFIADLLFLSKVSHSLLVAAPPCAACACAHPYLLFAICYLLFAIWDLVFGETGPEPSHPSQ
jgi:hypothetical protein